MTAPRALLCFFILVCVGGAPDAWARSKRAKSSLKIGTLAPDGTSWVDGVRRLDRAMRSTTDNGVGLRVYPGGVQGDDLALVEKIRAGKLHGALLTGVGMGAVVPWSRVLEQPFAFETDKNADAAVHALDDELRAAFEREGFVILGFVEVGFLYLFSTKELRAVSDLKRVKPWVLTGDPFAARLFKNLGAPALELPIGSVREALVSGRVDTVYHAPGAVIGLQWWNKVKFQYAQPIARAVGAFVVSKASMDALDAQARAALINLGTQTCAGIVNEARIANVAALATLRERGVVLAEPRAGQAKAFRAAGHAAALTLVGTLYTKEQLEKVRAFAN